MSDEFQLDMKVLQWREMIRKGQGDAISKEDMRQALSILRGDRKAAQTGKEAAASSKEKKPAPKDASALLADFAAQAGGLSLKASSNESDQSDPAKP